MYLKKKALYEIAKSQCRNVPLLKDCSYSFFRGSEWLTFNSSNGNSVKVYACDCGETVRLTEYFFDELLERDVVVVDYFLKTSSALKLKSKLFFDALCNSVKEC